MGKTTTFYLLSLKTSAYMIEEELKEQLRKKQEALKHFQRQVKRRQNQSAPYSRVQYGGFRQGRTHGRFACLRSQRRSRRSKARG